MAYDVSAIDAALKVIYQKGLPYLLYKKSPFFAWLPKTTNFGGKRKEVTVAYSGGVAYSTFANSKANATEVPLASFDVTRKKIYAHGFLDGEAMEAAANDDGALIRTVQHGITGAMKGFERQSEHALFHSGGGARGQIATGGISGATITLTDRKDCRWFFKNQIIQLSADDGVTASAGVRSGTLTVSKINRKDGIITFTGNVTSGIAAAAAGDYVFQQGDYQNVPNSIFSWVPDTEAKAATTFLGQDRSFDTAALAGVRLDATGLTTEAAIIEADAEADAQGASVDVCWVSSARFAEMAKNVQSKTYFHDTLKVSPTLSIQGLAFHGGKSGKIMIMKEPAMPDDKALMTTRDCWELSSTKNGWPHFSKEDGLKLARVHDSDQVEFVLKAYGNLLCHRPLDNVLINFAA